MIGEFRNSSHLYSSHFDILQLDFAFGFRALQEGNQ